MLAHRAQILVPPDRGYSAALPAGLRAAGYEPTTRHVRDPRPGDLLVIWNRRRSQEPLARAWEVAGAAVLVAENGYLGKGWRGETWISLSLDQHGGPGRWPRGDATRWDSLGEPLSPWRASDEGELLLLAQRGIGSSVTAVPHAWPRRVQQRLRPRVRHHPGTRRGTPVSLEEDLVGVRAALTWSSGAALRALMLGVPIYYGMRGWIGAAAATYFSPERQALPPPARDDSARLAVFRRLAWAMWRLDELAAGAPLLAMREEGLLR